MAVKSFSSAARVPFQQSGRQSAIIWNGCPAQEPSDAVKDAVLDDSREPDVLSRHRELSVRSQKGIQTARAWSMTLNPGAEP
jgi:hypothetical protein